jgi:predicted permease
VAEVHVDFNAFILATAVALGSALVFAALPLVSIGGDTARLRVRRDGGAPHGVRAALVVTQIALALVLTCGTALVGRTLLRMAHIDPGFAPGTVTSFGLELPEGRYPMPPRDRYPRWPEVTNAYRRLTEQVEALPGVRGVTLAANAPMEEGFTTQVEVVGKEAPAGTSMEETYVHPVGAGYDEMLGVPLLAGRYLTAGDGPGAALVVVVNQSFARKYFGADDPVGRAVSFWGGGARRVVGVVGDVRFDGVDHASKPAIHPALVQLPFSGFHLLVASDLPPATLEREVRAAVAALEPDVALFDVAPLTRMLAETNGERRFVGTLLASFAGLSLLLAALGVYGLMSFSAAQRRREVGVRQALGANRRDLLRLFGRDGALITAAGLLAGLAAAIVATRWLRTLLFEVSPLDPLALSAAVVTLGAVSMAAVWLPARRAAGLDPLPLLREE